MQRGNRRCNRWEEFRWRPRSKGRSRPGFLALKWMSGLEASWASRAFNGLEFCSFGRFRSRVVLSGVVVWSCLFERPLWPAKECLLEAWFKQSWLVRFFTLASTGLWSRCHLLADVWTGCCIYPCMAFILGALPCLRHRPPAPHAMNVIPTLTKNVMGHDVSSWQETPKKAFDSLLQALGQEVSDPGLQLLVVPEGFQEPCWKKSVYHANIVTCAGTCSTWSIQYYRCFVDHSDP